MIKKTLTKITGTVLLFLILLILFFSILLIRNALAAQTPYLQAVINTDEAIEIQKSTIFNASQSFISDTAKEIKYEWDFGDGNKNEGIEVLHTYKNPGHYKVSLILKSGKDEAQTTSDVFVYKKLIVLLTDQADAKERIKNMQDFAEEKGVYIKVIDSFGSSTEFISEEVLTKKLTEESKNIQKANEIVVWTKENAGLNALSRYIRNNEKKTTLNFSQKTITVIETDISGNKNRIQRQFEVIKPKNIIIANEAAIYQLTESPNQTEFINTLKKGGYEYQIIDEKTGKLRPWNFMSYFVNILTNTGIPDNTIALLLILPVIATVVVFTKQVIGITTFGIYTPSIMTLSFLIIGMHAGLFTLLTAIAVGTAATFALKKVKMLFVPKMAIVMTIVALTLLLILITSIYLDLFNVEFLSIAIFPMLILSTLVEKFLSAKAEKGWHTALTLMIATVLVAIIAYFIAGGEINLGFTLFKFEFIKNSIMAYPELILLLIAIDVFLGRWTGLRILEHIRFREILRHIEEE